MRVIKPKVSLLKCTFHSEDFIERVARMVYKDFQGDRTALFKHLREIGHVDIFEHASATLQFIADYYTINEIASHRMATKTREPIKYCNWDHGKYTLSVSHCPPDFTEENSYRGWLRLARFSDIVFTSMLKNGGELSEARGMLLFSVKSELIMTCNFRQWLHFFSLRADPKKASNRMLELSNAAWELLLKEAPTVFQHNAPSAPEKPKEEDIKSIYSMFGFEKSDE